LVGDTFEWAGARVRIVAECTSLSATTLYLGAILAYSRGLAITFLGALAGAVVLWIYNLLRIGALVLVLHRWPQWFDVVHVYLWQSVSLVVVLSCFLAWVRAGARRPA
jgi:exosortase/archaeosortase family protein